MLSLLLYRFLFPFRFLFRFRFLFLFLLQFLFRIPDSGFRLPAFPDVRSNDNFISNSIVGNDSFFRGYSIYYSQYQLSCIYWVCRSNVNPTFKRRVFELEDSTGNPSPLIVLQYVFEGDPSSMEVKPHGRSKKNPRPFFTTASGTRIKCHSRRVLQGDRLQYMISSTKKQVMCYLEKHPPMFPEVQIKSSMSRRNFETSMKRISQLS